MIANRSAPALAVALLLSIVSIESSVATVPTQDERQAHDLLARLAATYKAMPGYSDEGTVTLALSSGGKTQRQSESKPFAFARPNRLAVSFEPVRYVSDGTSQFSLIADKYHVAEAPAKLTDETLATNPAASYYFGGMTGVPSMALFRLLASDDPAKAILEGVKRLDLEKDRTIEGQVLRSLKIVPEAGPDVRLLIDPESFLLRRVEIVPQPETVPEGITIEEISWTAGTITTKVPPDSAFTFGPPDDATKVESIAALMAGPGEARPPGDSLQGKPAPEFSIDLIAENGSYEAVRKNDLAGKVVLIDFWATWCGPCLRELPEVAGLIERYNTSPNAGKVRIIALSLDSNAPADADEVTEGELDEAEESDPRDEVRSLVESTLEKAEISLNRPPVGRVGLDPEGVVSSKFGVQAIPMVVLIDPDGIVRAVHVGYSPEVIGRLASEIDAILGTASNGSKP